MKTTILCFALVCWCISAQPTPTSDAAAGLSQFAIELLQSTSTEVGNFMNVAMSPFCVWTILALIKEGSDGKTASQLQQALHLGADFRKAIRKMEAELKSEANGVEIDNAGAIFTDKNRPLNFDFQFLARKVYNTSILPVDYTTPTATVNYINRWVSDLTHHRIKQIVVEDDMRDPHLVIANGLFFKGLWESPFNRSLSSQEMFYDDAGSVMGEVMLMHSKNHYWYSFVPELGAKVVELPYQGGRYSMIIIVPVKNNTLNHALERLSTVTMEGLYHRLQAEDEQYPEALIHISLPRVVIHSDYVLNKALEKLGVMDLFNDAKADLSRMSSYSTYLHKLIHKAEIVINEEGTTASSATGGVIIDRDMIPTVVANRPFAFFIVEKTMRLVMFAGKVVNPHM